MLSNINILIKIYCLSNLIGSLTIGENRLVVKGAEIKQRDFKYSLKKLLKDKPVFALIYVCPFVS